jgi:hypothetical protein
MVLPGTGAATSHSMTIEHVVLKSTPAGQQLRDTYTNCLLVCTYCNTARGDRYPHEKPDGTKLLNPVSDVWADHFRLNGYEVEPMPGDVDAEYTKEAYGVNDTVRTIRREKLADLIRRGLERIDDLKANILDLDRRIAAERTGGVPAAILLTERGRRNAQLRGEQDALRDLAGEPWDAPGGCHCTIPCKSVPTAVKDGWQPMPSVPLSAPPIPSKRKFRV